MNEYIIVYILSIIKSVLKIFRSKKILFYILSSIFIIQLDITFLQYLKKLNYIKMKLFLQYINI